MFLNFNDWIDSTESILVGVGHGIGALQSSTPVDQLRVLKLNFYQRSNFKQNNKIEKRRIRNVAGNVQQYFVLNHAIPFHSVELDFDLTSSHTKKV
jgi:hypothetical protein